MPKVRWGINARKVDATFDREKQFEPYDGPVPPTNSVYQFQIKVLKSVAGTREKLPQLRVGLELVPRSGRSEEKRFKGYFIMDFAPVSDKTAFRYVPLLDVLGVSVLDFETKTLTDNDGNIKSIGKWRNTGKELIRALLKNGIDKQGNTTVEVGGYYALSEVDDYDEEEEEDYDEEEYDDEEEEYDGDGEDEPF